MKLKLIESIKENFDSSFELDFDIDWLLEDTDDEGNASGTIYIDIDNAADDLWEFLDDGSEETLTDEQRDLFAEDDAAWEAYLEENFDALVDKYIDDFRDLYRDRALDKLYDNWDSYSDEELYNQHDEDMKDYYALVARNLGLR